MPKLIDLTGQRFGLLTVIERAPNKGKHTFWRCVCDCGSKHFAGSYDLISGHTKSCGCYKRVRAIETQTKHGMSDTRLYNIWLGMIRRCENKNRENYKHYGGRGIVVYDEWHDFETFKEWALGNGYADFLTIDRKDTNGNYSPENCQWASWQEQNDNRRSNHVLYVAGVKMTLTQAAAVFGVSKATVYRRLSSGTSLERALGVRPGVCVIQAEVIAQKANRPG